MGLSMQPAFTALAPEYVSLLAAMQITRAAKSIAERVLLGKHNFDAVELKTGVRKLWSLASFEREASSNFRLSPAQGDPWDRISVHAPKGRGPFQNFDAAAEDAYHLDKLDAVGLDNWTWARACYEGEMFNGFGYRSHGIHTPYLWAGTNVYTKGKYTSDGRFDPGVRDQQIGIVPLMVMMVSLDPALVLADLLPIAGAPSIVPAPQAAPMGFAAGRQDTLRLQAALNALGCDPALTVDGDAGAATVAAVKAFQAQSGIPVDGILTVDLLAAIESSAVSLGG